MDGRRWMEDVRMEDVWTEKDGWRRMDGGGWMEEDGWKRMDGGGWMEENE